ncbi:MAG: Shikimate 5-dehydrogenase I alpha [Burkholderiaceae bacterium]|jgi:shikimate dehydrogenase|nr:MAG: Shikimate 5-dehydrogenase I alpha [Burkholderiaceae bacterium]
MSIDLYCVMGHPVAHSKSPWIHARFAELTGQQLRYESRLAALDGFAASLREFINDPSGNARGCNVTVPFKFEAAALAESLTARAALARAANTLSFGAGGIVADNTDGIGLVHDLQYNAGVDLRGRDLLLLGAGGAAAGVLGPLIEAQPARIVVANRTADRAEALVARHHALALLRNTELKAQDLLELEADFDVIINATASSLGGAAVPVPARVLRPGALACDLMYGPAARGFLDWAREHGASARDGLGMLVEQAAESFFIWRGVRPPSAQVLAELRALTA